MVPKAEIALIALGWTALVGARVAAEPVLPQAETYRIPLTGQAEANVIHPAGGTGDMDGSGSVTLTIDPDRQQVCYDFTLARLSTPLMAHIHRGRALSNGPTVVTLFTGPADDLESCVPWAEHRLAEIVSDAPNFYVNLSTTEYPDGALRGQLQS